MYNQTRILVRASDKTCFVASLEALPTLDDGELPVIPAQTQFVGIRRSSEKWHCTQPSFCAEYQNLKHESSRWHMSI